MAALNWDHSTSAPSKHLVRSLVVAILVELAALTAMGWHTHWLAHPQKTTGLDESRFVEAQVFEVPQDAHLVDEGPQTPKKAEAKVSVKPAAHPAANRNSAAPTEEEKNVTESGPKSVPNHGPIALYAPPPEIPSYLQNQNVNAYVLIDFYVTAQGAVTPRLVGSSGNEELDAIALAKVKTWQFRPAEHDHHAIDAKVRLRIIFEVK